MRLDEIKPKLRIKATSVGSTEGLLIGLNHLEARRKGAVGTVVGPVAGHGGDVWWVRQDGEEPVAAYFFHEFEPLDDQTPYMGPLGSPEAEVLYE